MDPRIPFFLILAEHMIASMFRYATYLLWVSIPVVFAYFSSKKRIPSAITQLATRFDIQIPAWAYAAGFTVLAALIILALNKLGRFWEEKAGGRLKLIGYRNILRKQIEKELLPVNNEYHALKKTGFAHNRKPDFLLSLAKGRCLVPIRITTIPTWSASKKYSSRIVKEMNDAIKKLTGRRPDAVIPFGIVWAPHTILIDRTPTTVVRNNGNIIIVVQVPDIYYLRHLVLDLSHRSAYSTVSSRSDTDSITPDTAIPVTDYTVLS